MRPGTVALAMVVLVLAPALADAAAPPPGDGSPFPKGVMGAAPPQATPSPVPPVVAQPAPGRAACARPLRQACANQQASCRMSCLPMWSTNPGAPAFTPNDRAGCTRQCLTRYLACLNLHGCS